MNSGLLKEVKKLPFFFNELPLAFNEKKKKKKNHDWVHCFILMTGTLSVL